MKAAPGISPGDEWLRRPERGSKWLLQLLTWVTLRMGRPIGRVFLYPICLYFMVFSRGTRRISRRYLERILQRPARLRDIFRHYHAFGSTIHDRMYLLAGKHRYFRIHVEGASVIDPLTRSKRGVILLGSHLGSFEVLRAFGLYEKHLSLSVLLHVGATPNLNSVLHGLRPDVESRIIPMGPPESMLMIKERLDQGELVGILGDRVSGGEKTVRCTFLGEDTLFPEGPLLIASLLEVPVVLFFGLYRGGRRYDIHFELLAEKITLDRNRRSEDLQPWVQLYVTRLEHYCRLAPYNWFNFHGLPDDSRSARTGSFVPAGTLERSRI